jgi:hypothetical protein
VLAGALIFLSLPEEGDLQDLQSLLAPRCAFGPH